MTKDDLPPLPRPHQPDTYATAANTESVRKGYEMGGYLKTPAFYTADQMRIEELEDAAPLCDKHKPSGGKRAVCLICALQAQSAALSQISYLCGPPNDMECSPYDVHCDESAVVEQVRAQTARIAELERALRDIAEEWAGAECGEPVYAQEAYAIGLAKRMYALAADALKEKQ